MKILGRNGLFYYILAVIIHFIAPFVALGIVLIEKVKDFLLGIRKES